MPVLLLSLTWFLAATEAAPTSAAQPPSPAALAQADSDVKTDSLANWYGALKVYEAALAAAPDNYDNMLKVALTLNQILSGQSSAGGFNIDGISNREQDRKMCGIYGPRASGLADRAAEMRPNDVHALFARSVAYGYYAASFGIIEAIARGTVGKIRRNAQAIVDCDPKFDDGVGYFMLGVFNTLAPWPIGSNNDAKDYFTLSLQVNPRSLRNTYGMAVLQWRSGDHEAARKTFKTALGLPCMDPTEKPLCTFYHNEAQRVLALPD